MFRCIFDPLRHWEIYILCKNSIFGHISVFILFWSLIQHKKCVPEVKIHWNTYVIYNSSKYIGWFRIKNIFFWQNNNLSLASEGWIYLCTLKLPQKWLSGVKIHRNTCITYNSGMYIGWNIVKNVIFLRNKKFAPVPEG